MSLVASKPPQNSTSDESVGVEDVNLIDRLLKDQRELSAVERFSQKHSEANGNLLESSYRDLLPIRKPATGEQYAFEVDLDKCTGCKACVVACHSMNGLHEEESWRDVGMIRGVVDGKVEQQTVTTACHHCEDPACMNGCPVGAYEKEDDTGIVRHLDDQCIGCQYCSLKCPYDVPKYDKSLGIVRKCDMCHGRLEEGEAPACVQSCPNGAIKIKLVERGNVLASGDERMLPGAYLSEYTLPTTKFKSSRKLDDSMEASDESDLKPAHAHDPLVWMLMLTQVAVGLSVIDFMGRLLAPSWFAGMHLGIILGAVVLGKAGLFASFLHLGSPKGMWRVFLGLKKSWLSREVLMFGAWMPALIGYAVCVGWPYLYSWIPEWVSGYLPVEVPSWLTVCASAGAVMAGLLSVYCSVMVYVDTRRDFWTMKRTVGRFGGTALLGGFTGLVLAEALMKGDVSGWSLAGFVVAVLVKATVELNLLKPALSDEWSNEKKSALIQIRSLRNVLVGRWVALVAALLFSFLVCWVPILAVLVGIAVFVGELLERRIFFQAVVTLKMPG